LTTVALAPGDAASAASSSVAMLLLSISIMSLRVASVADIGRWLACIDRLVAETDPFDFQLYPYVKIIETFYMRVQKNLRC